ncbi:MAG TPA: hypothetical protein VIM57_02420, partial [Luteolibacter sp.]
WICKRHATRILAIQRDIRAEASGNLHLNRREVIAFRIRQEWSPSLGNSHPFSDAKASMRLMVMDSGASPFRGPQAGPRSH